MIAPRVETALVYQDPNQACNQGSILQLAGGEMLIAFNQERGRIHADSGQSCLIRSRDGGASWDQDTMQIVWPFTDHGGNWDCAINQLRDGTILMHTRLCSFIAPTALTRGDEQALSGGERLKRQTGYALFRSKNEGHTWEGPIPVNTYPVADAGHAKYICGGSGGGHIVELPDGGLLMPLMGTIRREDYGTTNLPVGETMRCFLLRSDDGGDNWEYWGTIAFDSAHIRSFQEPSMVRLASGRLICMMRAMVRPERYDNMWIAVSDDDGITWDPPRRTALWGYPPDLLPLEDGRVLAVYGYRRAPMAVHGCISPDGVQWDEDQVFVIRECQIGPPEDPAYWHIGYPSVAQSADGHIVVTYHEYSDPPSQIQYMLTSRFRLD